MKFLLLFSLIATNAAFGILRHKTHEAFCYNQEGIIKGHNIDASLRIASLSKLFTSYYIAEKLGFNHRYETTFELSSSRKLIIRGSKDPYFLEHGIFYIISTLKKAGINNLIEVIVDKDFYFHFKTNSSNFLDKLDIYFNTRKWHLRVAGNSLRIKDQYKNIKKLVKNRLGVELVKSPSFSVTKISTMEEDEIGLGEIKAKWTLPSVKMIEYLKILNSYSNNMTSDEFVDQLGGMSAYNKFFLDKGFRIDFVTGSGLNKGTGKNRRDNYASCRQVHKILSELRKKLKKDGYEPHDLLPVAKDDVGTLSDRFSDWDYREDFVFKTGTLKIKPTSALAAMHRSKLLNLVILGQDYTSYQALKSKEYKTINHILGKLKLKPSKNPYQAQDFLMFDTMRKNTF